MELINCIIIEDDELQTLNYKIFLEKQDIKILGTYKTVQSGLKSLKIKNPSFVLLDLYLGENSGLKIAEELHKTGIPYIIITGYPKEAIVEKAFKLNAEAILTKPFDEIALSYAIQKIKDKLSNKEYQKFFYVRDKSKLTRVFHTSILYIMTDGNYSTIITPEKKYVVKKSMRNLLKELPEETFIQTFRNITINYKNVKNVNWQSNTLTLLNDVELPIGKKYRQSINDLFNENYKIV